MQEKRGRFPTTQWSLVRSAGDDSAEAAAALETLCATYWYPIFAYVRRRGHSPAEAEDLTQSFFTRVIEKRDLGHADPHRGRFRTFLLTACEHFLSNQLDRSSALKRGGGHTIVSIDLALAEDRYHRSLRHDETPEQLFHRQWCVSLLTTVLDQVGQEYAESGRARLFERLRAFVALGATGDTHANAARDLDMSVDAVKVAVHRLRRRYRDALRERVAETVDSEEAVETELHDLRATLSGV